MILGGKEIKEELYPFKGNYLDLNGLRYHYLDEGQGEAVVMVHGNPTWSFFYRHLILGLRDKYRVIVPDHIGCGLSDKPDDSRYEYTLNRRANDLSRLLDNLKIERDITLVLHDWGGMIGMLYAHLNPEKIRRLVILNTAAFHLPKDKTIPWSLYLFRSCLGALIVRGQSGFSRIAFRVGVKQRLAREVRRAYLAPYDSWAHRRAILRFLQDIPLKPEDRCYALVSEMVQDLDRFQKIPTLICWGEGDFVLDETCLKEWIRYLPEAVVHRFPDAGHFILEDAHEKIVPLVKDFLQAHPAKQKIKKTIENDEFVNIATHVPAMAAQRPNALAVAIPAGRPLQGRQRYREYTFKELNELSDALAHGLTRSGIGRGVRTVVLVPPSLEFFVIASALTKVGAILVGADPGMGIKNLKKCIEETKPEAFIGIPRAHIARKIFRWAKKTIKINVTVGPRLFWGGLSYDGLLELGKSSSDFPIARTRKDEIAAILFTSGSTGVPKGAVYTHGMFAAQVEMIRQIFGVEPGEIDLPTFPLFAFFNIGLGSSIVIPDMDFTKPAQVDPRRVLEPILQYQVSSTFGSPSLIRRVGRHGAAHGFQLPSIKAVLSAGAPVYAKAIEGFAKMLSPGAQIFTPYGATEALPVSCIGSDEILQETRTKTDEGAGVCVGAPVSGVRIAIIPIGEEPISQWSEDLQLPQGEIGEIVVSGPMVSGEYFDRPDLTRLAKIPDPVNGGVWHRMGDVGYLDEKGRLWYCGRKSQRVTTPKQTLYTVSCEGVFNAHPLVARSALVGVSQNGVRRPILCVELEKGMGSINRQSLTQELLALGRQYPQTREIQTILYHKGFPVDVRHNAKIHREKLAIWAERKLS